MASVPIFNTGANTGIYLDNSQVNRSAEKLTSDIIGMEKLKTNKAIVDNEKFLEMMAVDPVALMTQRGIEIQSEELTKYNDKWAAEMKKHQGNLPQDKWIEMRKDRVDLESKQGRLAASQQRYLQELKMYESAPTKYNRDAFLQSSKNFYETGEYATGLAPALGRLNEALDKDVRAYFLAKPKEAVQSIQGKSGKVITTIASGDPKEGSQRVLSLLFNDETGGYLQDAVNEFISLPEETQIKYFDANKDGTVSDDEIALAQQFGSDIASFASNPIIKWAMEEKGKRYQTTRPQVSNPPGSSNFGGNSMGMVLNIDGKKYDYIPPTATTYKYSDDRGASNEFYHINLPATRSYKIGGDAKEVVAGTETDTIFTGTAINATVVGYDATGDNVILQPSGQDTSLGNTTTIVVPRKSIENQLPQLYINKGGKNVLIGDGVSVSKPAGTAARKKTFNAATGKFE